MPKKRDGVALFLRTKPVKILTSLKSGPKNATILSKEVDCTYSHTVKLLEQFMIYGLVQFNKKGRVKMVDLTKDGQDLAHEVEGVLMRLSRLK